MKQTNLMGAMVLAALGALQPTRVTLPRPAPKPAGAQGSKRKAALLEAAKRRQARWAK